MRSTLEKKRKKGGMKRILAIFMAICVTASMGCFGNDLVMAEVTENSGTESDVIDSGVCGENLTWTLDSDGVLTIDGSGEMENYMSLDSSTPWNDYCAAICKIVIGEGVTSIGGGAFWGCNNLRKVNLPDGIKTIGFDAFYLCTRLVEINLPASLKEIGSMAFYGCQNLSDIVIPAGVNLKEYAFRNCAIKEIKIPDGIERISAGLFTYCSSMQQVQLSTSVEKIENEAFYGCGLKKIVIPFSVKEIGDLVFGNCSNDAFAIVPPNVEIIGKFALGYYLSASTNKYEKLENYIIYGKSGSAAETYAIENGITFKDISEVVSQCSHDALTEVLAKTPTCKAAGNNAYWYCYDCGAAFSDSTATTELSATDVQLERNTDNHAGGTYLKNQVKATTTMAGYTGDTYCSGCDAFLEAGNTIPMVKLEVHANGQEDIPTIYVDKGGTTELFVTVSADHMEGLSYEWGYLDNGYYGTKIFLESTSEKCVVENIIKSGSYFCKVTDCYGNEAYARFDVRVNNNLKVFANGKEYYNKIYVDALQDAELVVSVEADNKEGLEYQWNYFSYKSYSTSTVGENSPTYTATKIEEAGSYYCVVTDCYGNAKTATFNVYVRNNLQVFPNGNVESPTILVNQGDNVDLFVTVNADNKEYFSYEWGIYAPLNGQGMYKIHLGCKDDKFTIQNVQRYSTYFCDVKDYYGNEECAWFYVGIENHLKVLANGNELCPDIIVNQGDNVELFVEVSADNMDNLRYNWGYYDDNAVWTPLDSTTERCTITDVQEAREYGCKVTDCYGNIEEAWFNVEIKNNLKVLANGQGDTSTVLVNKGESAELYVTVSADKMDNLTYRWGYYDDKGLWVSLDSTTERCTITDVQGVREYGCIVTDCYGNKESVWFKVGIDNHLAVYPAGTKDLFKEVYVGANEPFSLEVDVSTDDKEGLVYKWYYSNMDDKISGSIPVGENPNVCQIDGLSRYMTYRCEVTDRYGKTADTFFYVYVNGDTLTANDSGNPIADIEAKKGENVTLEVHSKNGNEAKYTYTWRYWDSEKQQSVTLSSQTSTCVIENVQKDMQIGVTVKDPEYGNIYYLTYNIIVKENSQDGDAGNSGSGNTGDSGNSGNGNSGNAGDSGDTEAGGGSSQGAGSEAGGGSSQGAGSEAGGGSSQEAGSGAGGGASTGAGSGTGTVTKTPDTAKDNNDNKSVTITKNPDGSKKEVVKEKEKNSKNKEVTVTTTKETNSKGKVTGVTEKSKIDNIAAGTAATVTVKKDGKDKVTSATASVSKTLAKDSKKTTISASIVEQLKEAAGTDVDVTMTVKGDDGKTKYKLKVDTADLKAGKDLYIYQLNTKTGEYTMVNAKKYSVSKNGNVSVSMDKNATYELVSEKDAKKLEKKILSKVKVKKSETSVKKGKKTAVTLSSGLNMKNVKSISYSTSSKSVATVSKSGSVTAKKAGTTTIKVKVTLKNGTTKTVKMKITVK